MPSLLRFRPSATVRDPAAAREALTESAEHFARLGATAEAEAVAVIAREL